MPMETKGKTKTNVLFVDDDRSFLHMVQSLMGDLSDGTWQTQVASSASEALERLKALPFHLAVLDFSMPGVGGLDLLKDLAKLYPNLCVAFLTSAKDPKSRLAALEAGAEVFLEKPDTPTGMESVYATLNELLKWHRKLGERGETRKASLIDIIKFECAAAHSRMIEIRIGTQEGSIYLKDGSVVHAETAGRRGQSAFTHLAAHPEAEFVVKGPVDSPERSVYRQWEFLILEAFQLREQLLQAPPEAKSAETAATSAEEGDTQSSAVSEVITASKRRTTPTAKGPAKTPAPSRQERAQPDPPSAPAKRAQPVPAQTAKSPPTASPVLPVATETPSVSLKPAPPGVTLATTISASETIVQEMLISSEKGEVLFEWRCQEPQRRLQAVQDIRARSLAVNERLTMGATDRVELLANEGRMVVQFQTDTALVVRTNTRSRPSASTVAPFNQPLADWLARQSHVNGLLACGLSRVNLAPVSCSYAGDLPSQELTGLWRQVTECLEQFRQQHFSAWQLRWIFERAQLYCVKRLDGLSLTALITLDPEDLDATAVRQMFLEFSALLGT